MANPIVYVLVNNELNMSPGKVAAQVAHAVSGLAGRSKCVEAFAGYYKRTVIVLGAKDAEQMRSLQHYLNTAGLDSYIYTDEGYNEVGAYSMTAMAVEPIEAENEEIREIFRPFRLFSGQEKRKWYKFWS